MQRGDGTIVNVAEITRFRWERLHIFGPYTSPERIHRELGFRWSPAARTGIEVNDGIALLVFTVGKRVVRSVNVPRNAGDFADLRREEGYTPETAEFVVSVEDEPGPWVYLRLFERQPAGE